MNIGFIGAGRMAQALGSGIARNISAAQFMISDPSADACQRFGKLVGQGITRIALSNADVPRNSDVVFIAVKPQMVNDALTGLESTDAPWPLIISVAAGVTLGRLSRQLGTTRIVRAMPNTPCLIGQGISALAAHKDVSESDVQAARQLLETVGQVVNVPESLLDAVTGLSGSGPAFVYTFIESLIEAGVAEGLPADIATRLTVQTVLGAAAMISETGQTPAILREQVTSPGGTTVAGLTEMARMGFSKSVAGAVHAATQRSVELGNS
jgi:pyrroline-5-carboxylate reductase